MSLESSGFHARLYLVNDKGLLTEVGYQSSDVSGEQAQHDVYKALFNEFIASERFKELTYGLYGNFQIEIEYLVHTRMPS